MKFKVILMSHNQEVRVETNKDFNEHSHFEDVVSSKPGGNYYWTPKMTKYVRQSIENHGKPKVLMRNMEEAGCFKDRQRPSWEQLYNKIHATKQTLKKDPPMMNTF